MAHTIELVTLHANDPGLVYWFVDGRRFGPLRRDYADKLGIRAGASWNKARAQKVEHLAQLQACHTAALSLLARRDYTQALLLERLGRRWPDAIAEATVEQMRAAGWVNDKTYAVRRAAKLSERRIVSRELLGAHLASEGVPETMAERAAHGAATSETQLGAEAKRLARSGKSPAVIARKFARAGFDVDTIQSAFSKARIAWDPDS
ncbi:MAG: RecX family transcriptional regulator [Planctomycetes bacterium]|nr:RecX family transcriptional regulator [Planctomycetota bacterium]